MGSRTKQGELADQVNVVSIGDEEDTQNFEFSCLESPRHQKIATIDMEMCGEVQVLDDSPECPEGGSIPIEPVSYTHLPSPRD